MYNLTEDLIGAIRAAIVSAPHYMIENLAKDRMPLERDVDADVLARHIAGKLAHDQDDEKRGEVLQWPITSDRQSQA